MLRRTPLFLVLLLAGCAPSDPEAPIDFDQDREDTAISVSLSQELPEVRKTGSCTIPDGCRVRMTVFPNRNEFTDQVGDSDLDVARIRIFSNENLLVDEVMARIEQDGSVNFRNYEHEFILEHGRYAFEYSIGASIPEVDLRIAYRGTNIATPEIRETCHETCDAYEAAECLTFDLAEACHRGCQIVSEPETTEFDRCATSGPEMMTSIDRCDTFCFYVIPGVSRFGGGCANEGDLSVPPLGGFCDEGFVCQVDVCIPDGG